jgi:hypothetical protein
VSAEVHLSPASVEAIASRVAELLCEDTAPATPRLIDAGEVARRFGLTRGWVYDHAAELGALRLGGGPRGRLRFDLAKVVEALTACSDGRESRPPESRTTPRKAPRLHRRPAGTDPELLPITPPGGSW